MLGKPFLPVVCLLAVGCGSGSDGSALATASTTSASGAGGASGSTTSTTTPGSGGGGGSVSSTGGGGGSSSSAGGSGGAAGHGAGGGNGGAAGQGGAGGSPPPPDFESIPWEKGGPVGFGVARKDAQNPLGENVFIGYAGYGVTLDESCAWVTALYPEALRDRGVRYVYCVQGPADPGYAKLEIGNSKIVASLLGQFGPSTKFVLVAAHSSGSFVAHELLQQLAGGLDPQGVTADAVVYFDLDGGTSGLTAPIVARLRKAYFVGARDAGTGTSSPNHAVMVNAAATYASAGGFVETDASASGCNAGATWCLHMTVITTKPHDPTKASAAADYTDFAGRPVVTTYIDTKAGEASLVP